MAEYVGKSLYLLWNGTQIDTHYRTFTPPESVGLEDASAGSDANVTRLTTLKDGSASLEMVAQDGTAGTALWATFVPGTAGTLEWAPEGTASTKARHHVNAIVESREPWLGYNTTTIWNVTWQFSGAVTDTVY